MAFGQNQNATKQGFKGVKTSCIPLWTREIKIPDTSIVPHLEYLHDRLRLGNKRLEIYDQNKNM